MSNPRHFMGEQARLAYSKLQTIVAFPDIAVLEDDKAFARFTRGRGWAEDKHPCLCGEWANNGHCPPHTVYIRGFPYQEKREGPQVHITRIIQVYAPGLVLAVIPTLVLHPYSLYLPIILTELTVEVKIGELSIDL